MAYRSFDPWWQRENGMFDNLLDEELDEKMNDASIAFRLWKKSGTTERCDLLRSLGDHLLEEKSQYAVIITSETGKVISQSVSEIEKCASLCFYYANNLEKFLVPENRKSSAPESLVSFEAQGLILGIMPWNFPWWQALRFMVPVIAGGNVALIKHSANVPVSALSIQRAFTLAGFPESICTNLFIDYAQTERIISLPAVRGVSLTGSNNAGKLIAKHAGEYLKKSVLELGGSDPVLILNDADLELAAEGVLFSRFHNCGQSCIAGKRLIIDEKISGNFLDILIDKIDTVKKGNPYETDTFIGPMVNEQALLELNHQVLKTISMGGRLLRGGKRLFDDKPIYDPTIITGAAPDSPLLCEEVFGPALPVVTFSDLSEAVEIANRTRFGLGASIWTTNRELALRIASDIDTGTVAVNGFVRSDPALPFGGVKDSGFGRELSIEGIREFINIKTISFFA